MTSTDVHAVVAELLSRVLDRAVAPPREASFVQDLGFDSVRVVELVAEIEDRFDITVPLDQVARIRTVGEIVDYIQAAITARVS